ncbi:MAG: sigma-70 family RNA polymerase sigma factor [Planctomycetota bacterium]
MTQRPSESQEPDAAVPDDSPETWVDRFGDGLFRYALARVGRHEIAEDLVQETFISAVRSQDRFRGDCARSTWLFAILRRRIADHFRSVARRRPECQQVDSLEPAGRSDGDGQGDVGGRSDGGGRSAQYPDNPSQSLPLQSVRGHDARDRGWDADPAAVCEDKEFRATLEACLQKIPAHLSEAFILRHQNGISPAEIREWLGISPTNLSMRLHRARLAVRDCLRKNWFGDDTEL